MHGLDRSNSVSITINPAFKAGANITVLISLDKNAILRGAALIAGFV